nr:MAG TPA: Protein of unknown function (DUF3848) [Caudoviricetes sp.]
MSDKTYIDGADTGATPATADTLQSLQGDTESTVQSTATADTVDPLATLQAKLQSLQAKLHKEFRWYCDTILQGGSLAVRIAYRVHCAVETIEMVDKGEVRDDPALGEHMCYIGSSLYTESDIDTLLAVEYLLDDLYDAWCKMSHSDTEWSDMVDMYLDDTVTRERGDK